MILHWDKIKKVKTTEQWANDGVFDGGPIGGYQPNMSDADKALWKAKLTGTKLGFPQVEIRRVFGGSQLLLIVNLGEGYNYKTHRAVDQAYFGKTPADFTWEITQEEIDECTYPTRGINVHMSMNGPMLMTFDEMEELNQAVHEAKVYLRLHEAENKKKEQA